MFRQTTLSRQTLIRCFAPMMVALLLGLNAQSASAGIGWCRADPLISVNGRTGHVYVDSTLEMYKIKTGKINVEIHVPVGTEYWAEPLDHGFGKGYKITFVENPELDTRGKTSEVRVLVYAPASKDSLPVRVTFHSDEKTHRDSIVTGNANEWVATDIVRI